MHTLEHGDVCDDCRQNYVMCEDCDTTFPDGDQVTVHKMDTYRWIDRERLVCDSCADNYSVCDSCSERHDNLNETLDGEDVCQNCQENMNWCEDCDGYYSGYGSDNHDHSGCDCSVPSGLDFTIKNGDGILRNDVRLSLDLPGGMISEVGMSLISNLVRKEGRRLGEDIDPALQVYSDEWYAARTARATIIDQWYEFSYKIEDGVGTDWQTNRGNFTKRLSRFAHQNGLKLPADLLTAIGNVAREQSVGSSVNMEITRDLNLPAAEFAHEDSCWWGSYADSRCALKTSGGIALRTFSEWGSVNGRAWAMPLRKVEKLIEPSKASVYHEAGTARGGHYGEYVLEQTEGPARLVETLAPTFDTVNPDAWMIFNGYGDLSGYAGARIMAQMSGLTYRKCDFEASPMYVNAGGYIVADEATVKMVAEQGLHLDLETHSDLYHTERAQIAAAA